MKGAQDVRKKRATKIAKERLRKVENVELIESLILERFREIEITTVTVWEYEGFFVIDEDITDIPFNKQSEAVLFNEFNNEEGYCATFLKMINGQKALSIKIID